MSVQRVRSLAPSSIVIVVAIWIGIEIEVDAAGRFILSIFAAFASEAAENRDRPVEFIPCSAIDALQYIASCLPPCS